MAGHIIHRQKVELKISDDADAFELQNRISRMLKDDLPTLLESMLNKISPNGSILRIDKLTIDLGTINSLNLENEFREKLIQQLSEALSKASIDKENESFIEVRQDQSLLDTLIFFLKFGHLPWYSSIKDFRDLEKDILETFSHENWTLLVKKLKQDISENNNLVQRIAWQFSESFLRSLLLEIMEGYSFNVDNICNDLLFIWKEINTDTDWTDQTRKIKFWQIVLHTALVKENDTIYELVKDMFSGSQLTRITGENPITSLQKNGRKKIQALIKKTGTEIVTNALIKMRITFENQVSQLNEMIHPFEEEEKPKDIKRNKESMESEMIVEYCGLVILHPFLQMYFQELGMLEDEDFRNEISRQRAVLLLHYLATGQTDAAEIHLLFPKLLCGMNFDEPVPATFDLTDKEKAESETLLKSVLGHWEPLSRSSIESLQQTFLQREGKLTQTDTGWKLYAEQKAVDVLLNKLPWGISTIRLPWMNDVLNVEWL
jgi:hypothetical protein